MTSSISATPLYKVIRRGEPVARVKLDPNLLPLVHLVRDARGCTVRGALELLIKTGFVAMRTYGFLDKIPKDDWLNLIYNRIGVDARALFKNAQSEAEKKA
jgi:hypothetical protein